MNTNVYSSTDCVLVFIFLAVFAERKLNSPAVIAYSGSKRAKKMCRNTLDDLVDSSTSECVRRPRLSPELFVHVMIRARTHTHTHTHTYTHTHTHTYIHTYTRVCVCVLESFHFHTHSLIHMFIIISSL